MPKLPSHLTEQELLDLLNSEDIPEDKVQIFDYTDDIVPFMGFYNITPGDTPVSKKLLYKLYKAYSKEPLDQRNFSTQMGGFVSQNARHFFINIDQFAISNQIYLKEKKKDKTKSISYQKHFDWFTKTAGVERGTTWVEGFILFFQYKDFCRERRVNPKLGYVNFHKFLKLHYTFRRIKENRALFFRVDSKTANKYTEEEKGVIRDARAKETRGSQEESTGNSKTPKAE